MAFSQAHLTPFGSFLTVNSLCVEYDWEIIALALQYKMYCNVAVRRRAS
jgi:hypothetical protein